MILIRLLSFLLAFSVSFGVSYFDSSHNEKPKLYLLKAKVCDSSTDSKDCNWHSERPDPWTLVVRIYKNRNVTLNSHDVGNLDDTTELEITLREALRERTDKSIEVEKVVWIWSDGGIKYGEITDLIEALNRAGAENVALDTNYVHYFP